MLLGADPEFFLVNSNFQLINAYKIIKNNKKNPKKINEFSFYYDNVALEANFPPAKTKEKFLEKIQKMFFEINKLICNNKVSLQASGEFSEEECKLDNAKEFGCEPDLDAYKLCYNKLPVKSFINSPQRFIGGHIHIGGYSQDAVCDPFLKPLFVYMLDLFLGIPAVLIDNSSNSYKRRNIFGKAGSYKTKNYGIEYRVLSPFWLGSPEKVNLIYDLIEFVFYAMNENIYEKFWNFKPENVGSKAKDAYQCFGYNSKDIIKTINECDLNLAYKYYRLIENYLPSKLIKAIDQQIAIKQDPLNFCWNF